MEDLAERPLDFEVLPVIRGPVPVDRLDQCAGLFLALAEAMQPADFFFKRRIDENVKGIRPRLKIIGRAAADNYAITLSSRLAHHVFGGFANTVCIHHLHPLSIQCAFKAAAHERPEEPGVQGIEAFLTLLYSGVVAAKDARDLDGKQLVPQFPTQPRCKFGSDVRRAAAVFAVDCDDFDH
jgi:hypothetical protein